jgi:hypothetical protein
MSRAHRAAPFLEHVYWTTFVEIERQASLAPVVIFRRRLHEKTEVICKENGYMTFGSRRLLGVPERRIGPVESAAGRCQLTAGQTAGCISLARKSSRPLRNTLAKDFAANCHFTANVRSQEQTHR